MSAHTGCSLYLCTSLCEYIFLSATTTTLIVSKVDYCCWMHVTVHYLPGCTQRCISVFVWSALRRRWFASEKSTLVVHFQTSWRPPFMTSHCQWSLIFCCWTTALWQPVWRRLVCFNTDSFLVDNLPARFTVNSVKLLGINLNSDFLSKSHVEAITSKATQRIYFLKQLRRAGVPQSNLLHFLHWGNQACVGIRCPTLESLAV